MRPLGERESSSSKTIKGIRCTSAKRDRLLTTRSSRPSRAGLSCTIERDPTIKVLAGLPVGMRALRDSVSDEWEWQEIGERRKARDRDLNTLVLVRPKAPPAARKEIFYLLTQRLRAVLYSSAPSGLLSRH